MLGGIKCYVNFLLFWGIILGRQKFSGAGSERGASLEENQPLGYKKCDTPVCKTSPNFECETFRIFKYEAVLSSVDAGRF